MGEPRGPRVAIIDYGMGNLFSVARACEAVGLEGTITASPVDVLAADAMILPGVGAMPDAISALRAQGMDKAIPRAVEAHKPFLGICLGLQLLMTEGTEFGRHAGLGLIPGTVVRFDQSSPHGPTLKVPHVGWNSVRRGALPPERWNRTPLETLGDGDCMYFVHSYFVVPESADVQLAWTTYGDTEFCSAVQRDWVFGCQFHPERSGPGGLKMYRAFSNLVRKSSHR